ncbi:MAG: glycoside hydrolase family 26 protein, partial [Caulobacterales bacterium]|nr:glycoside hydrolase family 26 protein [Caulobacterales bacterium]
MTARRWILAALCAIALAFTSSGEEPSTYGQTREGVIGAVTAAAADGRTLSGQQVNEYEVFIACTSFERIHELTGAWPAILGLELMFIIENPSYREHFMRRAREHAARGGIVTLTWHARNPIRVCPRGEYYKCASMPMSEDELARLLDPSTQEHRLWAADVDAVADVLAELTALGIAPIFRPYHEMNGHWFWWGQKEAYRELWRALHARLAGEHGLDQLVWAWSPDKESAGAEA